MRDSTRSRAHLGPEADPDVDARLTGPVERLGERELSIAEVLGRQGLENAAKST